MGKSYSILDSLKTNKQISDFIKLNYEHYSSFDIPDTIKKYEKQSDKIIEKKKVQPVYRIDLNNDNIIDLILINGYSAIHYLYRDTNQNKIFCKYLPKSRSGSFILPQKKRKQIVFEFYYLEYLSLDNEVEYKKKLRKSILVYSDSNFIEYKKKIKSYNINEIIIETTGCLGTCPAFKMNIKRNGQVYFSPKVPFDYLPINKNSISQIDDKRITQIINLLNYIDFPHLNSNYSVGATDNPTGYLEIKYNYKKITKIRDYGMQGTFGLALLFSEIRKLLYECDWKEIK